MPRNHHSPSNNRLGSISDDESIKSLDGVKYYNLMSQNDGKIPDATEKLVELIHSYSHVKKDDLCRLLK